MIRAVASLKDPLAVLIALAATVGMVAVGQPPPIAIAGGVAVLAVHVGSAAWLSRAGQPVAQPAAAVGWKDLGLTRKQAEVVVLIVLGLPSREIARRTFNSERTIENHVHNIYERLGVHSKAELITFAARRGLLGSADPPGSSEAQK